MNPIKFLRPRIAKLSYFSSKSNDSQQNPFHDKPNSNSTNKSHRVTIKRHLNISNTYFTKYFFLSSRMIFFLSFNLLSSFSLIQIAQESFSLRKTTLSFP